MGTNYYLETDFCPCCGKPKLSIHIGKASCGWKFLFYKQPCMNNFEEVKQLIHKGLIIDEYHEQICIEEFLKMVESKQKEKSHQGFLIDGYDFTDRPFS